MAAPSAPEHICNLALDDLKQASINSITTPVSTLEYLCQRNYDQVRRECLFAHPWKFAIKRIQLTPNPSTTPLFAYAYAYDLPNDYIRMITVGDDYIGDLKSAFEIENNQLLAGAGDTTFDGTTKDVRYLQDVTDVTKFSPGFIAYFRLKLAIRMSNKVNISSQIKQMLKDDFKEVEVEARAVNGQESRIKRIQYSRVLTKRRGLPGGIFASKYTIFNS